MPHRGSSPQQHPGHGLLSIGALSSATGIPIDTIRTWERRYGFPVPERKPSGHRVYPLATVPRLRRAAQAIAGGHRAAEVVPASESTLDALLGSLPPDRSLAPASPSTGPPGFLSPDWVEALGAVKDLDGERLRRRLQADWARLGPLSFLQQVSAFLTAVGNAWAEGSLDVRHEHFASGILGDFLRAVRAPLEDRSAGPMVALATLPGELHGLGIQMAALVFAQAGWRPLLLGVDTPVPQIAALAREMPLAAVAVSCVQPLGRAGTALLRSLRRRLPRQLPLLLGGQGSAAIHRMSGVHVFSDLAHLDRWVRSR